MKKYLYNKFYLPIISFLKLGVTPRSLAICVALGCVLGIIPLIGVTTLLCAIASITLRLNMAVIQLVNYIVYPLQLLLFIPFINLGIIVFDAEPLPFDVDQITMMLKENALDLVVQLGYFNALGVIMWLLIAPIILPVLYYIGRWVFAKAAIPDS